MDIMELGAIGELVGGVAVLVTLIYLVIQIRSSNRLAEAGTALTASQMLTEFHARVNQSDEFPELVVRAFSEPDSLNREERLRFLFLMAELFHAFEGVYRQREYGLVSDETWRPLERMIRRVLLVPFAREWWENDVQMFSEDFRDFVDAMPPTIDEIDYGHRVAEVTADR